MTGRSPDRGPALGATNRGNVSFNDALNTFYLRLYGVGRKEGNVSFNDALNTFYLRLYGVGRKEGNVSFNDALNTFYLRLYGVGRMEMFYLTTHSTHFIYGYMASDIWLRTILIVREETHCHHCMSHSFRLAARVL